MIGRWSRPDATTSRRSPGRGRGARRASALGVRYGLALFGEPADTAQGRAVHVYVDAPPAGRRASAALRSLEPLRVPHRRRFHRRRAVYTVLAATTAYPFAGSAQAPGIKHDAAEVRHSDGRARAVRAIARSLRAWPRATRTGPGIRLHPRGQSLSRWKAAPRALKAGDTSFPRQDHDARMQRQAVKVLTTTVKGQAKAAHPRS